MSNVFRTMVVHASRLAEAKAVAKGADWVGGPGMFTAGLAPIGGTFEDVDNYVSSGEMPQAVIDAFKSPQAAMAANAAADYPEVGFTIEDFAAMLALMDISEDSAQNVFARIGREIPSE